MSGWICSYRAIWDHPIFAGNASRVGVWDWMLKKAVWKDKRFKSGAYVIDLKRGQLCISQRQVEAETGMGRQAFRTFLVELEAEKAITLEKTQGITQGRSIITICKYDKYQSGEKGSNPANNQAATQEQPNKEQLNTLTNILPTEEAAASQPISVSVVTTALWNAGKQYLSSQDVKNPGSLIGKWLKASQPVEILSAIESAQKAGTQDPVSYITKMLNGDGNGNGHYNGSSQGKRPDAALEQIARLAGLGQTQGDGRN